MKQNARSKWYQKSVEEVLTQLQTDGHGITTDDVVERHKTFGYNSLEFKKPSVFARFVRQFNNPLVFILLAAFAMTLGLTFSGADMLVDSAVIMGVVILNAVLGFFQEGKAENALQALKEMIVPECTVRRDGKVSIIPTRDLVPGDLVLLEGGDKIPADLRLINVREAAADESVLTGESVTVEKHTEALEGENLSPGDQICMAFGGTFLARGTATGVVVEIGEGTEFGKIAALVKHTKTVLTPLQKKIAVFTKTLIIAIISLGLVNFVLGAFFGYSLVYSFLASVSLVVAAIPEMLPMIVTAILALAATAMARRNALIRRLPAAETLGCTTVICSDKTGTLTKNEMTVTRLYAAGRTYELSGVGYSPHGELSQAGAIISENVLGEPLRETLLAGALCNNAIVKEDGVHYKMIGDPTEGALVTSAMKVLVTPELDRLDDIPFESGNMYMATLHQAKNENVIYLKGSPERVLDMCSTQLGDDGMVPLDHPAFTQAANEMADAALRVIGMAMKKVPADKTTLSHEDLSDFVFAGLQGMIDPPREEAVVAIERCRGAGIRTVMITGDHMLTARAISRELGIIHGDDNRVLAGQELAEMSDAELSDAVEEHSVFARVAPEHKLRIAQSLQGGGHVVAMTGDGVNDAPALKAADIGVAMGITGTAVSKEASSMVLTDDNFATIVGAVEEGRHAWNSLEKAILFTLPTNGGQALLVMGAVLLAPFIPLFGVRLPLEPVQILWVNLFDSFFLTMPLMMERKAEHILDATPRDPAAKIASSLFLQRVLLVGLTIALTGFAVFHYFGAAAIVDGKVIDPLRLTQAQTAAFWAVLLVHLGFVMSARSVYRSAFSFSPFTNKWLLLGILTCIFVWSLPLISPVFSSMFRTAAFPAEWWLIILPTLLPAFIVLEIDKFVRRRMGVVPRV